MIREGKNNSGMSVIGVLQLVFIVLKLTGNLNWSWPWILSPTLIPLGIVLGGGIIYAIFILVLMGFGIDVDKFYKKRFDEDEE